jgi:hypothetical protein
MFIIHDEAFAPTSEFILPEMEFTSPLPVVCTGISLLISKNDVSFLEHTYVVYKEESSSEWLCCLTLESILEDLLAWFLIKADTSCLSTYSSLWSTSFVLGLASMLYSD